MKIVHFDHITLSRKIILLFKRLEDYDGTCKPVNYMPDGTTSIFPFNVGLVNGRGWYIDRSLGYQHLFYLKKIQIFILIHNRWKNLFIWVCNRSKHPIFLLYKFIKSKWNETFVIRTKIHRDRYWKWGETIHSTGNVYSTTNGNI